ncbi:MAG: hypothetical protein ABIG44_19215 [Planctomycetota bacterium]
MATRRDYDAEAVAAANSVILELTRLLGEYRQHIVLVGGWVPELLLPSAEPKHVGSLDVDLALDHRELSEAGYATIRELLLGRGYEQDPQRQPFIFHRRVIVGERQIVVEVDLLAGEYEGTDRRHRTQKVQDVRPRKARGCDLALDMAVEVELKGTLPGGAKDTATIRVASIIPFVVMKGMALVDRLKEKDAYDIYFCVKQYPGGADGLADEFRPHITHGLVREGLRNIAGKFESPRGYGPTAVADFLEITDVEERERICRDAHEQINALLHGLEIEGAG